MDISMQLSEWNLFLAIISQTLGWRTKGEGSWVPTAVAVRWESEEQRYETAPNLTKSMKIGHLFVQWLDNPSVAWLSPWPWARLLQPDVKSCLRVKGLKLCISQE